MEDHQEPTNGAEIIAALLNGTESEFDLLMKDIELLNKSRIHTNNGELEQHLAEQSASPAAKDDLKSQEEEEEEIRIMKADVAIRLFDSDGNTNAAMVKAHAKVAKTVALLLSSALSGKTDFVSVEDFFINTLGSDLYEAVIVHQGEVLDWDPERLEDWLLGFSEKLEVLRGTRSQEEKSLESVHNFVHQMGTYGPLSGKAVLVMELMKSVVDTILEKRKHLDPEKTELSPEETRVIEEVRWAMTYLVMRVCTGFYSRDIWMPHQPRHISQVRFEDLCNPFQACVRRAMNSPILSENDKQIADSLRNQGSLVVRMDKTQNYNISTNQLVLARKAEAKERKEMEKNQKFKGPNSDHESNKSIKNADPIANYRPPKYRNRDANERERDRQRERERDRERIQERQRGMERGGYLRDDDHSETNPPKKWCTFCNGGGHDNKNCFGGNNPNANAREENKRKYEDRKRNRQGERR